MEDNIKALTIETSLYPPSSSIFHMLHITAGLLGRGQPRIGDTSPQKVWLSVQVLTHPGHPYPKLDLCVDKWTSRFHEEILASSLEGFCRSEIFGAELENIAFVDHQHANARGAPQGLYFQVPPPASLELKQLSGEEAKSLQANKQVQLHTETCPHRALTKDNDDLDENREN